MQCYRTYAATVLIANFLEILPQVGRKLPHAVIAEWMLQHDLEPEDVLYAEPARVKALLARLLETSQPNYSNAA